jgi:hypothetical protein
LAGVGFFQSGELAHDGKLIHVGKPVLKPLKIIAEGAKGSHSSLFIRFQKGAPEVVLDESASYNLDVHESDSAV